jgi:hypothetical protein
MTKSPGNREKGWLGLESLALFPVAAPLDRDSLNNLL